MKKQLLLIFVKNPALGKVKTRLAATIGNENALAIYHQLVAHTNHVITPLSVEKHVYYSEFKGENDLWDQFTKEIQTGQSLGDRLENAFSKGYSLGFEQIIVIGSDCLEIQTHHIEEAFRQLTTHDVVIGPANDGGYYLLGTRKYLPELFKEKSWSTNTLLQETQKTITQLNLTMHLLEPLSDIDDIHDLKKHKEYEQYIP